MKKLIRSAIDLILPPGCCICGRFPDARGKIPYAVPDNFCICSQCLSGLVPQPSDNRFFPLMSEPYEGDPHPGLKLYMPFPYKGFCSAAMPKIKFHSHPELASFLGMVLGSLMESDGIKADLVVPVPLAPSRYRERGYNQAGLIAQEAAKICGIPYSEEVLIRTRDTMRQTQITDNAMRSSNVEGAFKVKDDFVTDGLTILLIDDVATTGNTLHEAASALYESGAGRVLCAAFAGNRAVLNAEPC